MEDQLDYFNTDSCQSPSKDMTATDDLMRSIDYDMEAPPKQELIPAAQNYDPQDDDNNDVSIKSMITNQKKKTNIKNLMLKAKKINTRINRKRKRGPEPSNSALYYYRMDVLEEVAEKYPNASPSDIVEVVQSQWEKLDKKAKEQYYRLAQLDKKRFDEEAKQYIPRSEGGTMKRPKRKKHPNAPKHPMSGFLYFAADQRAIVKAENPGKNFTEIAKILGDKWRKIDPDTKKRYDERSDIDKARYRKEKMSFEPCPLVMETKKRKKHPLAPKHPLSGYLFFVANNRGEFNKRYPDKNFTEVANLLGQHWKTLSEKEKRKYNILAAADKKRYEEEKQKWQPPIERDNIPYTSFMTLPKKPMTAYSFWAYQQRAKIMQSRPYMDKKELTRLLREQWNNTPDKEKNIYNEKAEADRIRYQRELAMLPQQYRTSIGLNSYSQVAYTKLSRSERLARVAPEVMQWTPEDVQKLLQICEVGPETAKKLAVFNVSGRDFVNHTASSLKSRVGLTDYGDVRRICRVISLVSL